MRISFVRDALAAFGAVAVPCGDAAAVLSVPGQDLSAAVVLTDLSPFPRTGFKGADTAKWLTAEGLTCPPASNRTALQSDGSLLVRLSPGEFLLLGRPGAGAGLVEKLDAAWSWDTVVCRPQSDELRGAAGAGMCFPVPRQDSHAWFHLSGSAVPAMFAKLCGVDLRHREFADGAVAQTQVARLSAIIIRQGESYHLLADSASAEYLWACVVDAMTEFGGAVAGAGHLLPKAS